MEDKRKTLVLFDVGCVLVKLDYGSFYREAAKLAGESTPLAAEEFKQRYISSGIEEQINLDQMSGPEFLDKMSKMISGKPIDKSALCKAIDVCWHAQ
ncbi:MAG: hypothetical protein KAR20_29320, partial [Candidatus Heimdallarchaeota archaeon]|nr:hypothetical protein [Candidatus Heimdallarchaeota archaeon]